MKRWIGIDPGSNGAIAMIAENGEIELLDLTDESLIECCRSWQSDECICCVEDVASSPQMGVKSAFTFGEGFGKIQMALKCFNISFALIKPSKWKSELGCNLSRSATTTQKKARDIEVCKRLYPTISLKRTERCKTDSDGFADSLLMATYAKRRL